MRFLSIRLKINGFSESFVKTAIDVFVVNTIFTPWWKYRQFLRVWPTFSDHISTLKACNCFGDGVSKTPTPTHLYTSTFYSSIINTNQLITVWPNLITISPFGLRVTVKEKRVKVIGHWSQSSSWKSRILFVLALCLTNLAIRWGMCPTLPLAVRLNQWIILRYKVSSCSWWQ